LDIKVKLDDNSAAEIIQKEVRTYLQSLGFYEAKVQESNQEQ
jgi:hypothetical protein